MYFLLLLCLLFTYGFLSAFISSPIFQSRGFRQQYRISVHCLCLLGISFVRVCMYVCVRGPIFQCLLILTSSVKYTLWFFFLSLPSFHPSRLACYLGCLFFLSSSQIFTSHVYLISITRIKHSLPSLVLL